MHAAALPLHSDSPHSAAGSVRAGMGAQLPTAPATLHASHVPLHAPLQHTPSTQKPDVHSLAAAQDAPATRLAAHVPPLQKAPALQSESAEHGAVQLPAPSHSAKPHSSPGSVRADTAEQVPTAPARSHARHAPAQAVSQHTPSTQEPEAQALAEVQGLPSGWTERHEPLAGSQ